MKTLIKNGTVITMNEKYEKFEKLDIVYENNKIIFVGKNYNNEYDELIDATNKVVMPGLINCHTHLGMSLFRCSNDNYKLDDWLKNYIWPIEDKLSDEDLYYTTLFSCIEMIKTGSTCFNDMYYGKLNMDAIIKSNIRGLYTRCLMGNLRNGLYRIKELKELISQYKDNELIRFNISPHSLYTCDLEYLKKCSNLAKEYKLPIHIHLSENLEEVNDIKNKYGMLPVNVLKETGILDSKVILAHGTFISNDEIELLKNYDVSICTNPISNLNLGCGIADLVKYKKNKINLCLGTDGQGSGNNLNLFYHMSIVDYLQKGKYQDPTVMSSYDVLKMATINGAKALGYNNLGSIKEGNLADIIILDLNDLLVTPITNLISLIVHNCFGNVVDTTIINGKILMKNKKLMLDIDEKNLINKINEIKNKINQ